jgi:hypothetical protein
MAIELRDDGSLTEYIGGRGRYCQQQEWDDNRSDVVQIVVMVIVQSHNNSNGLGKE